MISVIHNLYKQNPYARESVVLNVKALQAAKVPFQYICFNDNGDVAIKDDLGAILNEPRVEYIYSEVNYGKKMCSGGWVGALPYVKGDYIHNTGQDDVFTPNFYRQLGGALDADPTLMLTYCNGISTNPNLTPKNVMLPLEPQPLYDNPFEAFKAWYGYGANGRDELTRANNFIAAPGVVYRKKLHELIGPPDLDNFLGSADFEFWSRVLFYGHKVKYFNLPLWLYRVSDFSTTNVTEDCKGKTVDWNKKILTKFQSLYKSLKTIKPS